MGTLSITASPGSSGAATRDLHLREADVRPCWSALSPTLLSRNRDSGRGETLSTVERGMRAGVCDAGMDGDFVVVVNLSSDGLGAGRSLLRCAVLAAAPW